jgi:hypothetical protein
MIGRRVRRFEWAVLVGGAALAAVLTGCASQSPSPSSPEAAAAVAPPAPLEGEWGVQVKFYEHPVDGVLRFSRAARGAMVGSFSDNEGNQSELEELKVDGDKISFKMEGRNGTISARGRIDGTIMSGKMKLKRIDEESGFGIGAGGGAGGPAGPGGRRVGESDTYVWTAIKRVVPAETPK